MMLLLYRCPCGRLISLDSSGVSNPIMQNERVIRQAWTCWCDRKIPQENTCLYCARKLHVRDLTVDMQERWSCRASKECITAMEARS